jgi:hypothetical protein
VPGCTRTQGDRGGLRFSLDGGATLAPNATRLDPLAYTWDIDLDPRDPDVLLELHQGTLFISQDAGCTLHVLAELQRSFDDLVRAPSNPELLVATTVFASEIGISRNGGADWIVEPVPDDVVHMAIDPENAEHWVFAGRNGLYERASGDDRWSALPVPLRDSASITTATHAPTGLIGDAVSGVFLTEDLATWVESNTGLGGEIGEPPEPVQAIVPVWLTFAPGDESVAYLSVNRVGRNKSERGLWRSDDGGATWTNRVVEGQLVGDLRVELTGGTRVFVSPHDPNHALFAFGATINGYGTDLFRSSDGLASLEVSHFDDFYEVFAVAFGPPDSRVLFVGASSDIPMRLRK